MVRRSHRRKGGGHELALMADGQIRIVKRRQRKNIVLMLDSRRYSLPQFRALIDRLRRAQTVAQQRELFNAIEPAVLFVNRAEYNRLFPPAVPPPPPDRLYCTGAALIVLGKKKLDTKRGEGGLVTYFIDQSYAEFIHEIDEQMTHEEVLALLEREIYDCLNQYSLRAHNRLQQRFPDQIRPLINDAAVNLQNDSAVVYLDVIIFRYYTLTDPSRRFRGYRNRVIDAMPLRRRLPIERHNYRAIRRIFRQFKANDDPAFFEEFVPNPRYRAKTIFRLFREIAGD